MKGKSKESGQWAAGQPTCPRCTLLEDVLQPVQLLQAALSLLLPTLGSLSHLIQSLQQLQNLRGASNVIVILTEIAYDQGLKQQLHHAQVH